MVLRDSGSFN
jgi:hypothetical protein